MSASEKSVKPDSASVIREPLGKLFLRFLHFGLMAWGGPVAQIAMIRQELVEEEKWVTKERFNRALAVYQVLPGPEAHELCVYFGMLAHGRAGAFLAGLGFMLPGLVFMLILSWLYVRFGLQSAAFTAVLAGFQPAVAALIVRSVHRIGQHALTCPRLYAIAATGALAALFNVPFYIPLAAAGAAYAVHRKNSAVSNILLGLSLAGTLFWALSAGHGEMTAAAAGGNIKPHAGALFLYGLRAGLLTFGGAYTAIPFLRNDAVITGAWMTDAQFLDGLALSGVVPAPLVIFATFVGYLGGGMGGALAITAGMFLPAFGFTLLGHDLMEKLIHHKPLHDFLDGIAAGVVGMIAVVFIRIFPAAVTDWKRFLIFAAAALVLYRLKAKWTPALVILVSGLAGFLILR